MGMLEMIDDLCNRVLESIDALTAPHDVEDLRVQTLGKKGEMTELMRGMKDVPEHERRTVGQRINEARQMIENALTDCERTISEAEKAERLSAETVDVTMPGVVPPQGTLHPISVVTDDLIDIFRSMGFDVVDGPEIETEYFNFEALNVPADHPARDMQDTLYVGDGLLLRTQTSATQIRTMKTRKPPIRMICPGRVYRADEVDATHSPIFHQLEGLVVDKGVTMCDLKGVLEEFAHKIYGADTKIQFRPSFFPFTEPSVEVDVSCSECGGKGCRMCKGSGWIEILGAGMVHPRVLAGCGIDPEVYSGFAFGIGLDRSAITRYKISDIRLLFEDDVRFLGQFHQ